MKIGQRFNPHRMFDGVFIPESICQYRGISPGSKIAYGRFCRFAGRNGEVYPSMATLGREIGCSETQARSYVKELLEDGFVEVERESGKVNTYYFIWHPAFDGEVGVIRFAPPQDAEGVETPSGSCTPPPQDAGRVPPQDAEAEESHLKESHERDLTPPTPSEDSNVQPIDPESGEPIETSGKTRIGRAPFKKSWKRPKEERPHGMSDRLRELREGAHNQAADGLDRLIPRSPVPQTPSIEPAASQPDFPSRWNALVPERPVDRVLLGRNPSSYHDRVFADRFDEICQKGKDLIAAGADLEFGFLLMEDRKSGQYRWQQLLAGQLSWMKAKTATASAAKPPVDATALAAQMRIELQQKRAQHAQTPDTQQKP